MTAAVVGIDVSLSEEASPSDSVTIADPAKSATSTFDSELPVPLASNVLFVKVNVSDAMLASSASTYAFIDCCVANAVLELDEKLSSSRIVFVATPPSKLRLPTIIMPSLIVTEVESEELIVLVLMTSI